MKLDVPFVRNLKKWSGRGWCGPIALASILRYYNDKSTVEKIAPAIGCYGGTPPRGPMHFCLDNGFNVDYLTKYDKFSYNHYPKRFSETLKKFKIKISEDDFERKNNKFDRYKKIVKQPTLKDIVKYLNQKKPVLIYLNDAILEDEYSKSLWPHYVIVVGHDENNLYLHNIFPKNRKYQKIPKKIFLKAWKSDGMNDMMIIPYKS